VDLDRQMTMLAALQGRYTAATQMLRKRFALLEYAITSGGAR
jgi:flagellar basal body rod protein FlgB